MVDQTRASWNQLMCWLRNVEALRRAAVFESSAASQPNKSNKISDLQG